MQQTTGLPRHPAVTGYEHDWTCLRCRRVHIWRAGQAKGIKRGMNHRERQIAKRALRVGVDTF
jgi:hypothetical protein